MARETKRTPKATCHLGHWRNPTKKEGEGERLIRQEHRLAIFDGLVRHRPGHDLSVPTLRGLINGSRGRGSIVPRKLQRPGGFACLFFAKNLKATLFVGVWVDILPWQGRPPKDTQIELVELPAKYPRG